MSSAQTLPSTTTTTTTTTDRPSPSTTGKPASRRVWRRIGAVLGGLVTIFAVTTATDVVMHRSGVFPPLDAPPMSGPLFLLAFAYRLVFDVAGSALTARLAPDRPMRHALALGAIGLVLSIAGAAALWNAGPHWYPIAIAASALPSAWLGARWLGARRPRRDRAPGDVRGGPGHSPLAPAGAQTLQSPDAAAQELRGAP
jgi:hypothetical protein